MVGIIRQPATSEQLAQMSEAFGEALIKLAVEVQDPTLLSRIEAIVRRLLEVD